MFLPTSDGADRGGRSALSIALSFAAILGLAALPAFALADTAIGLAAVKNRQKVMDGLGDDVKTIHKFVTGQGTTADAATAAANLNKLAQQVPSLFPPGTSQTDFPGKSAAKPEIWDNPDDMKSLEQALQTDAAALETATATGDATKTSGALGTLAHNSCGACHQTYRGKSD